MGSNGVDEVMISGGDEAECSEAIVEIKIKTLDSQTYTLRVNKRMPVPALKEQIATVTGVLSEQQRLICRGKVLRDDQLLSAYHVEDGHTLHLVVRQPIPPSSASTMGFMGSESLSNHPGADPTSSTGHSQGSQVAHSVVLGSFNVADQGDGILPDLNRIVSAVLGSIFSSIGSGSEGINQRETGLGRLDRTSNASVMAESTRSQPDPSTTGAQSDSLHGDFQIPNAISSGPLQPPVIPDSLTTLSQYVSHMRQEFIANERGQSSNAQNAGMHRSEAQEYDATSHSGAGQGLPTPASLAEVMLTTRQMLIDQAGECLLQLTRRLEDQENVTDPLARMTTQSITVRSGILLQNLGALLLELGRTTLTLRMGRTPSEAVVNAGPALFISTSGPNPIMVQPLPFQPVTSFGAIPMGTVHPGSGLVGGTLGSGFLPRNIDIQIHTGSSISAASANQGEQAGAQQPPGQTAPARSSGGATFVHQVASGAPENPSITEESGVRVVPIRTMLAAVPAPVSRPPNSSGSQGSGERQPSGPENEQQQIHAFTVYEQNIVGLNMVAPITGENSANAEVQHQQGSFSTSISRQPEHSNSNINTLQGGVNQNGQEAVVQIPNRFDQFLRTIFPSEHIHVGDVNFQGVATATVTEHSRMTGGAVNAREAAPSIVSDEGIFFSSLLRQIMPFISQVAAVEPNSASPRGDTSQHRTARGSLIQTEEKPNVGTSDWSSDPPPNSPNSKRQKRE